MGIIHLMITCLVYVQIKTYASEQAEFTILITETAKSLEIFHDIENLVPLIQTDNSGIGIVITTS